MTWVRMDDKRAMHPKLCDAGFAARGLDEAAIELCASEETDGFISDKRLSLLGAAHGERNVCKLADRLVECGRWERDDERGGYVIRDYLHYNPSHADLEAKRESDRNRKRRGSDSSSTPNGIREDSARNPAGIPPDSNAPRTRARTGRDGTGRTGKEVAALFDRFYAAYPLRKAPRDAERAFAKAIDRADPEEIILGARRYAADPTRKPDFTAYPATWLNDDRWKDEPTSAPNDATPTTAEDASLAARRRLLESNLAGHRKAIDPDLDAIAELELELSRLTKEAECPSS